MRRFRKGLDLCFEGAPAQHIDEAGPVPDVALLPGEYPGLHARLAVAVGDSVRRGDVLWWDKSQPKVVFTAPAAGTISAIHRGDRRALLAVVVQIDPARDGHPANGEPEHHGFRGRPGQIPDRESLTELLLASGAWTALRQRPFDRVPDPAAQPEAIFVTAVDTAPHAPRPEVVLHGREAHFESGLCALEKLTEGALFLCTAADSTLTAGRSAAKVERFAGPHPAGNVGVHMHWLCPVGAEHPVWHVGYQDVAAIGELLATGRWPVERVVSLSGHGVRRPRLLRTRLGANLAGLLEGELESADTNQRGPDGGARTCSERLRLVSGSVLDGRDASDERLAYLGRYERQVTVLADAPRRRLLGWMKPWRAKARRGLDSDSHGGRRAVVPVAAHQGVMPMRILMTPLLRAIAAGDVVRAVELGALELVEEDLALCTYVCPSKIDYGSALRGVLDRVANGE